MFVREKAVKVGNKTHIYVQVVKSVREENVEIPQRRGFHDQGAKRDFDVLLASSLEEVSAVVRTPLPACQLSSWARDPLLVFLFA